MQAGLKFGSRRPFAGVFADPSAVRVAAGTGDDMKINGYSHSGQVGAIAPETTQARRAPSSNPPPLAAGAARAQISGPGRLFSRLGQLAQQDPAKFKEVAAQISEQLHALSDASGKKNGFVDALAQRFDAAAQSGDMSSFRPAMPGLGHHHGHHHHSAAGGNDDVRSVLENALDLVNQSLASASDGAASAIGSTASPPPDSSLDASGAAPAPIAAFGTAPESDASAEASVA